MANTTKKKSTTSKNSKSTTTKRPTNSTSSRSRSSKNKKQLPLYLVILAIILIVVIVVVYLFAFGGYEDLKVYLSKQNNSSNNSNNNSNNSSNSPATSTFEYTGNEEVKIHFVSLGQGDGIVVELPGDRFMLIDAGIEYMSTGYSDNKNYYLGYVEDIVGNDQIDYLICTHPDYDHVSIMKNILDDYEVLNIYYNDFSWDTVHCSATYTKFMDAAKAEPEANVCAIDEDVDRTITVLNDGFLSIVIYSNGNHGIEGTTYSKDSTMQNQMSLLTLLTFGNRQIFFAGDSTTGQEQWFVDYMTEQNIDLDVDFLKVAHHGSAAASTTLFLDYINAEYGIISVGAGNSYGLPKDAALNRLAAANVIVYRTDINGTIILDIEYDGDFEFSFKQKPVD